eukprot:5860253-Pyramimonas_sp.AAC.1
MQLDTQGLRGGRARVQARRRDRACRERRLLEKEDEYGSRGRKRRCQLQRGFPACPGGGSLVDDFPKNKKKALGRNSSVVGARCCAGRERGGTGGE